MGQPKLQIKKKVVISNQLYQNAMFWLLSNHLFINRFFFAALKHHTLFTSNSFKVYIKMYSTLKSQCCTQTFLGHTRAYIYCILEWNRRAPPFFQNFEYLDLCTSSLVKGLFTNLVLKNLGFMFGCLYQFIGRK